MGTEAYQFGTVWTPLGAILTGWAIHSKLEDLAIFGGIILLVGSIAFIKGWIAKRKRRRIC